MSSLLKLTAIAVSLSPCLSFAEGTYIQTEFGYAEVKFDQEYRVGDSENNDSIDGGTANFQFGYEFSSGFVIAATADFMGNATFFGDSDNFQFYQAGALVGYAIPVSEHFRINPSVGLAMWELDAEEGEFLNPGPEDSIEENGTDFYWKLSLEFPINERFQLNTSYAYNDYDFGEIETIRFGFRFNLQ